MQWTKVNIHYFISFSISFSLPLRQVTILVRLRKCSLVQLNTFLCPLVFFPYSRTFIPTNNQRYPWPMCLVAWSIVQ